jgi:hypothetical protein
LQQRHNLAPQHSYAYRPVVVPHERWEVDKFSSEAGSLRGYYDDHTRTVYFES